MYKKLNYKNGQLYLNSNGLITIGRDGWFGRIWQRFFKQPQSFYIRDLISIDQKKPGIMRGYLRLKTEKGVSELWITSQKMWDSNTKIIQSINDIIEKQ